MVGSGGALQTSRSLSPSSSQHFCWTGIGRRLEVLDVRRTEVIVVEHGGPPLDPDQIEDLLHEEYGQWIRARVVIRDDG